MDAYVSIRTPNGSEVLSVHVDDHDPLIVLSLREIKVYLTRDEARRAADALRAAACRSPFDEG
jgi:hypothetical protein